MDSQSAADSSCLSTPEAIDARTFLNLGCGKRFRPGWTNVDVVSTGPGVIPHDLRTGLPFVDDTFNLVYHSHVLEHFSRNAAPAFIAECFRVLRSGGVIRVAIPDLERIARCYVDALDNVLANRDERNAERYQWIMLEMYDQTVREFPGGEMARQLRAPSTTLRDFAIERLGIEARNLMPDRSIDAVRNSESSGPPAARSLQNGSAPKTSVAHPGIRKPFFRRVAGLVRHPSRLREALLQMALGNEYDMLRLGRFRRGGEIHQWMYDRYSLSKLLIDAGFSQTACCGPANSRMPDWAGFYLDTQPDGSANKPDSLYMEATKP